MFMNINLKWIFIFICFLCFLSLSNVCAIENNSTDLIQENLVDKPILTENNTNLNKNKNNNLQRYIQHITKISKGKKKNSVTTNKTSVKNSKMSIKKNTTSKNNTTYTNKTQSQPSISYRHKKVSMITKSMPKLSTYFDNNIKNNQNSKNTIQNQLFK